jgi:hypothetical protein
VAAMPAAGRFVRRLGRGGVLLLFVVAGLGLRLAFGQSLRPGDAYDRSDSRRLQVAPHRSGRLPCVDIVSAADRLRHKDPRHPVDVTKLSRNLQQEQLWVQHCMELYGRQMSKRLRVGEEEREGRMESWEESEPDEIGPEETGEGRYNPDRERRHGRKKFPATPTPFTGESQAGQ